MLLISQYALEAMRFDEDSNNWECSEIRKWLNGYFYNKVFNDNEKKNINSFDGDNVFLMSKEEAEKYFANNEARKCKSTEYAKKNGAWVAGSHYGDKVAGYSVWWLRSSRGKSVLYVSSGGKFYYSGVDYATVVVRPALWINI